MLETISAPAALATAHQALTRAIDGEPIALTREQAMSIRAALWDAQSTAARQRATAQRSKDRESQLITQVVDEEARAARAERALALEAQRVDVLVDVLALWIADPANAVMADRARAALEAVGRTAGASGRHRPQAAKPRGRRPTLRGSGG